MRIDLLHFLSLAASLGPLVRLANVDCNHFPTFFRSGVFHQPLGNDVPEFWFVGKCLARIAMLVAGMFIGRGICWDKDDLQMHNLVVAWFDCLCQRSLLQLHAAFEDRFSLDPQPIRNSGLFLVATGNSYVA